ncbi:MAG: N-acetylmuramoyl-L-alanine amidase-like domain-containing protein [Chloroflexota bacterium]
MEEDIILGEWTKESLDGLLLASSGIPDSGRRVEYLSRQLLGTAYGESTLKGDSVTPEVFVVNLKEVDCFTFLDYVEAMRRSSSFSGFRESLKRVRYRDASVAFSRRNHFFTDWTVYNVGLIRDVTGQIGGGHTVTAMKALNRRGDGECFIPGLPVTHRAVTYVPTELLSEEGRGRLQTGDYVGVYSDLEGLDVSHVGIVVRDGAALRFRHASSVLSHRRVIDEDFASYFIGKAGIVVVRPTDSSP